MLPNQLIICGGGASIREGIEKGLFNILPNKFSIGLNYFYKYCQTTATASVDEPFYESYYNDIDKLPLHIAKQSNFLTKKSNNTYFLKPALKYDPTLKSGVYKQTLVGLFALSLGIYLIEEGASLFLVGFDNGQYRDKDGKLAFHNGKPLTHFYQGEFDHRGIGLIDWYSHTSIDYELTQKRISQAEKEYRWYKDSKVKIYNVSPNSNIPTFEKIDYDTFFKMIEDEIFNQEELRNILRVKLKYLQQTQNNT